MHNSRRPRTELFGTPKLVSSQSEAPFLLVITIWERLCKYDLIHRRADLENSSWWMSLSSSFDDDTVSKALLRSLTNSSVTIFLSMAMPILSISLSTAIWIPWCLQYRAWRLFKESNRLLLLRYAMIWLWAIFSGTLERKQRALWDKSPKLMIELLRGVSLG